MDSIQLENVTMQTVIRDFRIIQIDYNDEQGVTWIVKYKHCVDRWEILPGEEDFIHDELCRWPETLSSKQVTLILIGMDLRL